MKVCDNGTPSLCDEELITITVNEVNVAPVLTGVPATASIPELVVFTFDANVTDPDVPANTLTFSLVGAPSGASIDPTTGVFSWTPSEAQGPGSYPFTVKVCDNGIPPICDEEPITITVTETNTPPVLALIGDKTVNFPNTLTFTATATDPDIPVQTLTFTLDAASIALGMSINPTTGAFSWTPALAQVGFIYPVTITVTDNGINPANLSDFETFNITVSNPYVLTATVFLQGPFNMTTELMDPTLSLNGQVPLAQPYNMAPWNYAGTETVTAPGPGDVDWVLIELRSDLTTMEARKAAMLHTDGTVTASFDGLITPGEEYYVVIRHRNHMPVMSDFKIEIPLLGTSIDLSILSNAYGIKPLIQMGTTGIYAMIAGEVIPDGQLKYSGAYNDRGQILSRLVAEGGVLVSDTEEDGYWSEDVNMNNELKYIGSTPTPNDRGYIINNISTLLPTTFLTDIYYCEVPGVWSGLKSSPSGNDGPVNIHLAGSSQGIQVLLSTGELIQNGLIDNLQFTLAWNAGDTDVEEMLSVFASDLMLEPQGDPINVNGIMHQVYVTVIPTYLPSMWNAGEDMTAIYFTTETGDQIMDRLWIADDGFTLQNNADYYVSIWGSDYTGMIADPVIVSVDDPDPTVTVRAYPNPVYDGRLTVDIVTVRNQNLKINIFDASGTLLINLPWQIMSGHSMRVLDLSQLPPGAYMLGIVGEQLNYQKKLILLTLN